MARPEGHQAAGKPAPPAARAAARGHGRPVDPALGRPLRGTSSTPAPLARAACSPLPQAADPSSCCPVRTSRRFRQLATPLQRRPVTPCSMSPSHWPGGERGRRGERDAAQGGGARAGRPPPGMPGAAGRRPHCMLGSEVFPRPNGRVPVALPAGLLGSEVRGL